MSNHDNQSNPQIYYRPLCKWIEVTLEEKQKWERFVNAIRKAKQRAGACCIPYKKSYKCDGLCEECEFRCIPKDAPQHLSIDGEMEITQKNGTRNSFLADDVMTTVISIDSMILKQDIRELCPSLSISSIEGALRKLVASGELKREGFGKKICYYRLN